MLTTAAAVDDLCEAIRQAGRFALDTEFVGENSFLPRLALVQIALPDQRILLVDAQAVPDLGRLWELVADPGTETVVHALEQEARFCWHATGALPANLFDVQLAAAFTGERFPSALAHIARTFLGLRLDQRHTRTDWARRPLSAGQIEYAAEDVDHLLPLADQIAQGLHALGRHDWLAEESSARLATLQEDLTTPRWWRISGGHRLRGRHLAVVREIYLWREAVAASRDRPRRRILRDDLVIAAAEGLPEDEEGLRRIRGFERFPGRDLEAVLGAIQRAQTMPSSELPTLPQDRRNFAPPQARMLTLLLEALLESTCVEQRVDAALLGGASDLRDLVRWHLADRPSDETPALLQGWRAQVCGDLLGDALAGAVCLRVADPGSPHPLIVEPIPDRADE